MIKALLTLLASLGICGGIVYAIGTLSPVLGGFVAIVFILEML